MKKRPSVRSAVSRGKPSPSRKAASIIGSSILEKLEAFKRRDASYELGQILGSMCTAPHPLAVEAHLLFLESNLGDPGHFPGAQEIENQYLAWLLQLVQAAPGQGGGQVTSGASEANVLAMALFREKTGKNEVIVPSTFHFSFEKAAKFLGIKLRIADVDERRRVRLDSVNELLGPRTAGMVGIAGTTEFGSIDPLREMGELAEDHGVGLHVDAAFGGYLLPFLREPRSFGFDLPGVESVTVDSHKMGMGTLGAGALLVRNAADLGALAVETSYLTVARQSGLLGTRSGAPVAAAWALLENLGTKGYRAIVSECLATTQHLVQTLETHQVFPLVPPELNVVALPVDAPSQVQEDLQSLGWHVNIMPRLGALRLVCMPHVRKEIVDRFVPDLVEALEARGGGSHVTPTLSSPS